MNELLTVDQFKNALPTHIKSTVNQELIDTVNTSMADREAMEI